MIRSEEITDWAQTGAHSFDLMGIILSILSVIDWRETAWLD